MEQQQQYPSLITYLEITKLRYSNLNIMTSLLFPFHRQIRLSTCLHDIKGDSERDQKMDSRATEAHTFSTDYQQKRRTEDTIQKEQENSNNQTISHKCQQQKETRALPENGLEFDSLVNLFLSLLSICNVVRSIDFE